MYIGRKGGTGVSKSAQAVIIKYHGQCGLNNRNLFSHRSGGCKVHDQGLAGFSFWIRALFTVCRWPSSVSSHG